MPTWSGTLTLSEDAWRYVDGYRHDDELGIATALERALETLALGRSAPETDDYGCRFSAIDLAIRSPMQVTDSVAFAKLVDLYYRFLNGGDIVTQAETIRKQAEDAQEREMRRIRTNLLPTPGSR